MPEGAETKNTHVTSAAVASRRVRFGPYEADFRTGELRKHGSRVKVQGKPLAVLAALVENQGQLVSRQELQQALWAQDVFVDYEKNLNTAVNKLRDVLCDTAERPRYIETIPRRGYRFIVPVEVVDEKPTEPEPALVPALSTPQISSASPPLSSPASRKHRTWLLAAAALALLIVAAGGISLLSLYPISRPALAERDMVVLSEFANNTRDPVFDGTLRQGLATALEQSHFLNLLSDARVASTLALMELQPDTPLTSDVSRAVCLRTGSVATIEGSIANLGGEYVLWLKALDCKTGDLIANEQASAPGKDKVLDALAAASTRLRQKLGESLASLQKPDAPPENVTTRSLEALQAYSLGYRTLVVHNESTPAIPFFQRAIALDPNFAMAYARLGKCYDAVDQYGMAAVNFRKAYELRDRASERERFYIDAYYEYVVAGRLEAARERFESWAQTFPADPQPHASLGNIYTDLGDYEKARAERETALRLGADIGLNYGNLVWSHVALGEFEKARSIARDARHKGRDSPSIHLALFWAAWAQHDGPASAHEAEGLVGRPGAEEALLEAQQAVAAYQGQFAKATALTRTAVDTHLRHAEPEGAALVEATLALDHALAGAASRARIEGEAALARSPSKDAKAAVAIARALTGDVRAATEMAAELEAEYAEHTVVQRNYLPAIRAAIALQKHRPGEALAALDAATPYERGRLGYFLLPVYLRGQAFIASNDGTAAAAEFRKILEFPGPVPELVGALAHLGLARALTITGDTANAKARYQRFLAIWQDSDDDIPLLLAAIRESTRLR